MSGHTTLRAEPNVRLEDFAGAPTSWTALDERLTELTGRTSVALPSVRVGMCWALSFLGMQRHKDHVMLPKFIGRCILNSLNRVAFPVETFTTSTRALIPVHQYGFRQRLDLIDAACREWRIPYIEDSPFAVDVDEKPGPGSLAKFVGLSKTLPMLKGGFALSDNAELLAHMRERRHGTSAWSWPLLGIMSAMRWSSRATSHSTWMELAYELYPESAGDNAVFRLNFAAALRRFAEFENIVRQRMALVRQLLAHRAIVPDGVRIAAFALVRCGEYLEAAASVLRTNGFDAGAYHFDVERNMLAPRFERVLLLPLNPRIPESIFAATVAALASCLQAGNA